MQVYQGNGESNYFLGRRYRLRVAEHKVAGAGECAAA
jgi:hypothetical protein